MTAPAVPSAADVAAWFQKHAEKNGWLLETEKLQHLLFLSQMHFSLLNNGAVLMPAAFICDKNGFSEPNLARCAGCSASLTPKIDGSTQNFLEIIWKKYSPMSIRSLSNLIKNSPAYSSNYQPRETNLIDQHQTALLFKSGLGKQTQATGPKKTASIGHKSAPHKILISQNGPVVVSQWQPRKLSNTKSKETLNV